MRQTEKNTLDRLWAMLQAIGLENETPRKMGQLFRALPDARPDYLRAYLVETLFTGLYTDDPAILLRTWPQAAAYTETLAALKCEPGSYLRDRLCDLRNRVEGHFLRGES